MELSHGKNLPNVGQDYQCAKTGGGGGDIKTLKNGVGRNLGRMRKDVGRKKICFLKTTSDIYQFAKNRRNINLKKILST